MSHRRISLMLAALAIASCAPMQRNVGPLRGGAYLVPTGQIIKASGDQLVLPTRPVDLAISPNKKWLYAKDDKGLAVIDTEAWRVAQQLPFGKDIGGSMHGIAVSHDGARVFATSAQRQLFEFAVNADGSLTIARTILLRGPNDGESHPTGIALTRDGRTAYVCLSRNNAVAELDLVEGSIREMLPTGVAPYAVVLSDDEATLYVTNWGGRHPRAGERSAPSSGTPVIVDERGVAASGTLSIIHPGTRTSREVDTGLHPTAIAISTDGNTAYVANANSDSITVISLSESNVLRTLRAAPSKQALPGAAPNALLLDETHDRLYVANAGANTIAVFDTLGSSETASNTGAAVLNTGWYPGALAADGAFIYCANVKGHGSRRLNPNEPGFDVHSYTGTITRVRMPSDAAIRRATAKHAAKPADNATSKSSGVAPTPIPRRIGEPSLIKHVVYVIKENRTYDQVFGDMPQGNSDPDLCIFGREITPNHHAIAEQFVLLDNYYCNGVCSADGHAWATEGNVTDHLEKSFGGFTRSYTFGDDPLTYSSSGFIWDYVIDKGLAFRNYGEMRYTYVTPQDFGFYDILRDYTAGNKTFAFSHSIGIERLHRYSSADAPGWNMNVPDIMRADVFLKELAESEKTGAWPNFMILYLPQDHTSGMTPGKPTPRAHVADNDLALGRVVEGISKSRFWPETVVFVNEDDPQDGFDHVDGHRSLCLVVSPYTKRGEVVSHFYNQTSVLRTIGQIFGIPPWTQMVAVAPVMNECFTTSPDFTPYTALPNQVSLSEMNPLPRALSGAQKQSALTSATLDFEHVDAADEDTLNRILWHFAKGEAAYPTQFAGAHGRGLKALGLAFDANAEEEEENEK